ncbi:MAG: hypothetical protein ACI89J_003500 [Hyphomicrobiaceae bacterium]|jgi:hypothetical protein
MRWVTKVFISLLVCMTIQSSTLHAQSGMGVAPASDAKGERAALNSRWTGRWLGGGFVFDAELFLKVSKNNRASGHIAWTAVSAPPERRDYQNKIGLKGNEYVSGHYDPATRLVSLEGIRKDDPNNVIGLDKYRMVLTRNNKGLAGVSWSRGKWNSSIALQR